MIPQLIKTLSIFILCLTPLINIGQTPNLGTAAGFAFFTSSGAFNNYGASNITGNIGTNEGVLTGFPPGTLVGQSDVVDAISLQAATDVENVYTYLTGLTCGIVQGSPFGNGQTLTPNIYCLGDASTLNGNLILDAQGNPDAQFIFQINGALTVNSSSNIILTNSATLCNVFWQINGMFNLGDNSVFRGTAVANGAINLFTSSTLEGRGLTRAGAINLYAVTASIPAPPNITTEPANQSAYIGNSVSLTVSATGPSLIYQWQQNGLDILSATSTIYTINNAQTSDAGNYTCNISNTCGNILTSTATLTIKTAPLNAVWNGIGTWNTPTNWNPDIPANSSQITIASGTITFDSDLTVAAITINPLANATIPAGKTLTINGNFTLVSDVTGTGSIIDNGALIINGYTDVQRFMPGNRWTYIGTPIASATSAVFTGHYIKYFNETLTNAGDFTYYNGNWTYIKNTVTALNIMEGYAFWTYNANALLHFNGSVLNSGTYAINLSNSGYGWGDGWNLIANPYPSSIDWNIVTKSAELDDAVYYWDGTQYESYVNGVGASRYIPAMQGMFVHCTANTSLMFTNAVRAHDSHPFFKDKTLITNILSLKVDGNNYQDETFIRFDANATSQFDKAFDAYKMFGINAAPQIYSLTNDNLKLSINTLKSLNNGEFIMIPLGFRTESSGNYLFTIPQLNFDDQYLIYLTDNKTGSKINLRDTTNYQFTSDSGIFENRFVLSFTAQTITSVRQVNNTNDIKITNFKNNVMVSTTEATATVYVYDITGCELMQNNYAIQQINFTMSDIAGCYIIKVVTPKNCISQKIIVQQ